MPQMMIIACDNIRNELMAAVRETGKRIPILYLPQDAHQNPDRMREYLQSLLDRLVNVDMILLPMGSCGNATKGLTCATASLVLPRCEDCIDILLSPTQATRNHKSFYLTAGWLNNPYSIDTEFDYTLNKYGEETTQSIMQAMYGNYEGFIALDTGAYDLESTIESVVPLATMVGLGTKRQEGSYSMLKDMLNQEFDERFVVIPPGETVSEEHFKPRATG